MSRDARSRSRPGAAPIAGVSSTTNRMSTLRFTLPLKGPSRRDLRAAGCPPSRTGRASAIRRNLRPASLPAPARTASRLWQSCHASGPDIEQGARREMPAERRGRGRLDRQPVGGVAPRIGAAAVLVASAAGASHRLRPWTLRAGRAGGAADRRRQDRDSRLRDPGGAADGAGGRRRAPFGGVAAAVALPGGPVRDRRVPAARAGAAAVRPAAVGAGRHRRGRDHAGGARAYAAPAGRGDRDRDDRAALAARARRRRRRGRGADGRAAARSLVAGGGIRRLGRDSRPPSPTPPVR